MSYRHYQSPNLQTQNDIIEKIGKGMRLTVSIELIQTFLKSTMLITEFLES
jgi:hypothetical protein